MDLDAHGVAQPVAEAALVARAVDNIPGNLVHLAAFVARFGESAAGELRLQNGIIYLFLLVGHMAHRHRARHIGAVSVYIRAEVHGDEVPCLDAFVAGHAVRQARFCPRDKDRVERQLARAVALHKHFHLQRGVDFPHAGLDVAQHVLEAGVGDDLRAADGVEFFLGLDGPDGVDGVGEHGAGVHLHARQRGAHTVRISQCGLVLQIQMLNAVRGQDVPHLLQCLSL